MPELLDLLSANVTIENTGKVITLANGARCDLTALSVPQLRALQWSQEPAFAARIVNTRKGTAARRETIRQAYETVCAILDQIAACQGHRADTLAMGMDDRYASMVLEILADLERQGIDGGLFEVGFGSGILLHRAATAGYRVGGLEVTESLYQAAIRKLDPAHQANLHIGDLLTADLAPWQGSFSVAYWNDVFEHVPVDEVLEYLSKIRTLLVPGGVLITFTPNWHMRPMDVTGDFLPPRSTAVGFHLKEYTLAEVTSLLRDAGFYRVTTPNFIGLRRIYWRNRVELTRLKIACESFLEWLPYRVAVQCCRRFGYNCTLAFTAA